MTQIKKLPIKERHFIACLYVYICEPEGNPNLLILLTLSNLELGLPLIMHAYLHFIFYS